jgi:hypothetical protein
MMSDEEKKIEYSVDKILEFHSILMWAINRLIKNNSDEPRGKAYYPIPSLILCFCFLDFLRRFDYIWKNGKDGKENQGNKINYTSFLKNFIIQNDEYNDKNYSFTADELYDIRCDLIHSFCLKDLYKNNYISFVDGIFFNTEENLNNLKKIISTQKKINLQDVKIIKIYDFLNIIKTGIKKMFDEYKNQLLATIKSHQNNQKLLSNIDSLSKELEQSIPYYTTIEKPNHLII